MKKLLSILSFAAAFAVGCFFVLSYAWSVPTSSSVSAPVSDVFDLPVPPMREDKVIIAEYDTSRTDSGDLIWASDFHSEDFPYKGGEKWLGLFNEGDTFVIRSTRLRVSKISDPVLHDLNVTTARQGESVFLFRDLPNVNESLVPTAFLADQDSDESLKNDTRDIEFNGIRYSLIVENPTGGEYLEEGSKLTFSAHGVHQVLRHLPRGCNDCSWTLIWAGDLDLDGKLDLFIDLTDHYNVQDRVLFLSSEAEKGKLVKISGNFRSVGC